MGKRSKGIIASGEPNVRYLISNSSFYIVCVLMLGIPGMVAEFIVGRHGASNAMRAYGRVGGKP